MNNKSSVVEVLVGLFNVPRAEVERLLQNGVNEEDTKLLLEAQAKKREALDEQRKRLENKKS